MAIPVLLLLCSLIAYSATVQKTSQDDAYQEESLHILKRQTNQTCGEYKHCATWKNNGFCTNAFYPQDLKMKWCGRECGLC
ncbi:hypothetical protein Y032_0132g1706 [Ancylostoma ceylanicum]|uniref:ShKT domain-containing protein n=1 Tax=Ancylostoma ceylanicum TaxID=53326 RepID=A0A016T6E9_9BILA|nr:hypothetical protein Y032_0132g1706 [Ancylostoma ceylanicum]